MLPCLSLLAVTTGCCLLPLRSLPLVLSLLSSTLSPSSQDVITPTDVSLHSSHDKSTQKLHISGGRNQNLLPKTKHAHNFHLQAQIDKAWPHFFLLFCFHSLGYSLIGVAFTAGTQQLFPSPCFPLDTSPLPGAGSQTTRLLQRMESSPIEHRHPAETIDANLLMTSLWRLLKQHHRDRKLLLQTGGAARFLHLRA